MPLSIVHSQVGSIATGNQVDFIPSVSPAIGDFVFVTIVLKAGTDLTTYDSQNGFTKIGQNSNGVNFSVARWGKFATSADTTSPVWTWNWGPTTTSGIVIVYIARGIDPGHDFLSSVYTISDTQDTATATYPNFTIPSSKGILLAFMGTGANSDTNNMTGPTGPTNVAMNEVQDFDRGASSSNFAESALYDQIVEGQNGVLLSGKTGTITTAVRTFLGWQYLPEDPLQPRVAPDAILSQTGLSGNIAALQDDPDSPDANWLTAL